MSQNIDEIRAAHTPSSASEEQDSSWSCSADGNPWPCDTARVLDALDAEWGDLLRRGRQVNQDAFDNTKLRALLAETVEALKVADSWMTTAVADLGSRGRVSARNRDGLRVAREAVRAVLARVSETGENE